MRFIVRDRLLETDDGELIKEFDCPLEKHWDDLLPWAHDWREEEPNDRKRLCGACSKAVVNFQHYSESQIIALVEVNPEVCGYLTASHPDLTEIVGDLQEDTLNIPGVGTACTRTRSTVSGERVIKTARSFLALQEGVDRGYRPLFRPNVDCGRIHQKWAVVYDRKTGKLRAGGDARSGVPFNQELMDEWYGKGSGVVLCGDFGRASSPLAAYLLPPDLHPGERVFLEDLIEDRVGAAWNQGDTYRALSGWAIWNGTDLELEQAEDDDSGVIEFMG